MKTLSMYLDVQLVYSNMFINIRIYRICITCISWAILNTSLISSYPYKISVVTSCDTQVINEWRFLILKEFNYANVEVEIEGFNRYMQNVDLVEDVFSINSTLNEQIQDERPSKTINRKLEKRIQYIVDHKLRKLEKFELVDHTNELSNTEGDEKTAKKIKFSQGERALALTELIDKLNKARKEEDLKACWEMASQIFGNGFSDCDMSIEKRCYCFPPKWVTPGMIDEEALSRLNAQFSSLEEMNIYRLVPFFKGKCCLFSRFRYQHLAFFLKVKD
ncbi:hypothetical protein ACJIZ3_003854 [Penstemon smallii]|uniref:Uncharacterized protein n=1 Tax=Penstemon smallii TaxID=265156 RepID=A0ABD3S0D8_9LAMI